MRSSRQNALDHARGRCPSSARPREVRKMARARTPIRSLAAAAPLLSVTLGAGAARAGCATGAEARDLQRSIRFAAHCNDKILRSGPGTTCKQAAPPACAGTLATDAVALAYGNNNPASAAVNRTLM